MTKKKVIKKKKKTNKKRMMHEGNEFHFLGHALYYDVRPFTVRYKERSTTIMLPGYYPIGEGDSVHTGDHLVIVEETQKKLMNNEAIDKNTFP